MNDDEKDGVCITDPIGREQRRDDLIRGITTIDEIRAGRGAPADSELNASRLAILNGTTPPAASRLRVIQGGKA